MSRISSQILTSSLSIFSGNALSSARGHGRLGEDVAIMAAIPIVVVVGSVNDYQKEGQAPDKVPCDGRESMKDVMGDVHLLERGEIASDGVLLSGHGVRYDEGRATGKSEWIAKFEAPLKASDVPSSAPEYHIRGQ
ncbi:hypothetical protein FIBSPDRAFT_952780 [Athelia psychrophila]|uniref:Uncharacterized protein n=1 Tax=Athelia psychrophila TaxID=1759441 RepID=A0A166L881_9AGAM|nr:hypothetical protein FIBSPDRAFT_952780 [Fibularhizoctonia sp. CBS 109695]